MILIFYLALLMLIQVVFYASLPKDQYRGCHPPPWPGTRVTEQIKNEIIYCRPQGDGFVIIGPDEYSRAYRVSDSYAPAVIAHFIWTDHGTLFSRVSLWHLSDRTRYLEFYARCGEHSQTQWTTNEHALRSSITRETGKLRYSMTAYSAGSLPVFEAPLVAAKLLVNGLLILLARRLAYAYKRHVWPQIHSAMQTDPNKCIYCGYDCAGLPTPLCPECGNEHA